MLVHEPPHGFISQEVPAAQRAVQAARQHNVLLDGVPLHTHHLHRVALGDDDRVD